MKEIIYKYKRMQKSLIKGRYYFIDDEEGRCIIVEA